MSMRNPINFYTFVGFFVEGFSPHSIFAISFFNRKIIFFSKRDM